MPEYPSLVTEVYEYASMSGPLAKGDLIMSRAKKGVVSEGKGVTPQEKSGSDLTAEMMVNLMTIMEKNVQGLKKHFHETDRLFDEMSECLESWRRHDGRPSRSPRGDKYAEEQCF